MRRRFDRKSGVRRLFIKVLAHNLIMKGRISTTTTRAKAIRPVVERFVTIGKKQNTAAFRMLLAKLPKVSAEKVYYELAKKYADRKGGYTRIIKVGTTRKRDSAPVSMIEFV